MRKILLPQKGLIAIFVCFGRSVTQYTAATVEYLGAPQIYFTIIYTDAAFSILDVCNQNSLLSSFNITDVIGIRTSIIEVGPDSN